MFKLCLFRVPGVRHSAQIAKTYKIHWQDKRNINKEQKYHSTKIHIHCNIRSDLLLLDSGFSLNTKKSVRFESGLKRF